MNNQVAGIRALYPVLVLAVTSLSVSSSSGQFQDPFQPRPALDPSLFSLVQVTVEVRSGEGSPASQGGLFCYCHDLALHYPNAFGNTAALTNGRAVIHLPKGTCTLNACGLGYFLTLVTNITGDSTFVLRPEATNSISVNGFDGRPLLGANLFAVNAKLKPLFPPFYLCGVAWTQPFPIAVSKDTQLDLVWLQEPPVGHSNGEAYYLLFSDVSPGSNIVLTCSTDALAHVNFDVLNAQGEHAPVTSLYVGVASCSVDLMLSLYRDNNVHWDELGLWIEPGQTLFSFSSWPESGWTFNFVPTILQLEAGQSYSIRGGGRLNSQVWFYPAQNPRQIYVEMFDSFTGGCSTMLPPSDNAYPLLRFKDAHGTVVDEERLYSTFDKDLACDPTGLNYELSMDLGFFGTNFLGGFCFTPDSTLATVTNFTDHFQIELPIEFASSSPDFAAMAEVAYGAISSAIGCDLVQRAIYEPTLFGAGWTGGSTLACHYADLRDPRALHFPDDTFKGAFSHELGHVFQGTSAGLLDYGEPDPECKEAAASTFRDIAKQQIVGAPSNRYTIARNRENFFLMLYTQQGFAGELQRGDCPECFESYWRYYFILTYLKDVFGPEVMRRFVHVWGSSRVQPYLRLFAQQQGISDQELTCGLYSLAADQNLSWLFQTAGFSVAPQNVQRLTDWGAWAVRRPVITNLTILSQAVRLAWDTPSSRYIVETSESPAGGWYCCASSSGTLTNQIEFPGGPGQAAYYRLQFGLQAVDVQDPRLFQAIVAMLPAKVPPTNSLYDIELYPFTTLDLSGDAVTNLTGLQGFQSLRDLNLTGDPIVDLGPLGLMTSLSTLRLTQTAVQNLNALATLTNLSFLDISQTGITDLSPLADLVALQTLLGHDDRIADLSPLSGLTNLSRLHLYNNHIQDLEGLGSQTRLAALHLGANQITNLAPLATLTNLDWLILNDNRISNLRPLVALSTLRTLNLWNNQLSDLSPLGNLTPLEWLSLSWNQISDLAPLANLTNLNTLYLSANPLSDIDPLRGLSRLTFLELVGDQVSDIGALGGLTNLTSLNLINNRIVDLNPLLENANSGGLGAGAVVDLSGNPLSPNAITNQIPALRQRGVTVNWP